MVNKLKNILFSTRLMAILFLGFAIAMGVGTFIESKYNTDTARIWIYNAWWFEGIMLVFVLNFAGNIKRYQLYKKEKWATLLLHLSFIFIITGAFITRYISFEGVMPIREGVTENKFYSDKNFISIFVDGEHQGALKRRTFEKPVLFSEATNNHFILKEAFSGTPFEISLKSYIMGAHEAIKEDKKGKLFFKMVESGGGNRHEHYLKEGEVIDIHNILFSLNKFVKGAINISIKNNVYSINTPFDGNFMRMADKMQGNVSKNTEAPLMMRSLYNVGGSQFVFPEPAKIGFIEMVSSHDFKAKKQDDALILTIKTNNQTKDVTVVGSKGKQGEPQIIKIGKLEFTLAYGSKAYTLPFQIKLNDFVAQKYPGTEKSYSSYESHISVLDQNNFDYKIFMNHVLDYKGYRFFQSSFDPDEKGTVLSVSHDFWGTWITYIGYFILFLSLMAILFVKDSRFADLKRKLEIVKSKKNLLLIILCTSFNLVAQNHQTNVPTDQQLDSIINKYKVDEIHAAKFGRLIIQDLGGRMKPINTFSSELLRKVSHSDKYKDMNADQVFLSMTQFSNVWLQMPIIYIKPGNDSIRKIIGIPAQQKMARFVNFFDDKGNYKLSKYLDDAARTANPNQFEKDIVESDKKVNLMNSALFGSILKIFPIPNDVNNKWISYPELSEVKLTGMDAVFTKQILPIYVMSLQNAATTKQYKESDFYLDGMMKYQKKYGNKVLPTQQKIDTEILYNKYNTLQKLPYIYLTLASLMFVLVLIQIFTNHQLLKLLIHFIHLVIGLTFVVHTIDLIARWYIAGHAPWSNAYESIVYVAWAAMFFGLSFDIKSKLTVASAAFVTAMILAAASANWIDPEIANLQPVLNSYWLMIHVAVIVASYGPFALGMILGFVTLLLMVFTTKNNQKTMTLHIQELSIINEMALTVGLIMLTIGNFLGGQWANESWGRYWGWDPKETWALISIMVYAFVIHARFVPALRSKWLFSLMSMYAFIAILFTYYGVNFHLSGLHSYASGEAKSLSWIAQCFGFISFIGAISYFKFKKYYKK